MCMHIHAYTCIYTYTYWSLHSLLHAALSLLVVHHLLSCWSTTHQMQSCDCNRIIITGCCIMDPSGSWPLGIIPHPLGLSAPQALIPSAPQALSPSAWLWPPGFTTWPTYGRAHAMGNGNEARLWEHYRVWASLSMVLSLSLEIIKNSRMVNMHGL